MLGDRIRGLTEPYPCAYTYYKRRKVRLISSKLKDTDFYGEPGRVYLKKDGRLLVCAKDKCLWITSAKFEDSGNPVYPEISRYDCMATLKGVVEQVFSGEFRQGMDHP